MRIVNIVVSILLGALFVAASAVELLASNFTVTSEVQNYGVSGKLKKIIYHVVKKDGVDPSVKFYDLHVQIPSSVHPSNIVKPEN